jgi:hypothetical protein
MQTTFDLAAKFEKSLQITETSYDENGICREMVAVTRSNVWPAMGA